jgi:hypothetical protein
MRVQLCIGFMRMRRVGAGSGLYGLTLLLATIAMFTECGCMSLDSAVDAH